MTWSGHTLPGPAGVVEVPPRTPGSDPVPVTGRLVLPQVPGGSPVGYRFHRRHRRSSRRSGRGWQGQCPCDQCVDRAEDPTADGPTGAGTGGVETMGWFHEITCGTGTPDTPPPRVRDRPPGLSTHNPRRDSTPVGKDPDRTGAGTQTGSPTHVSGCSTPPPDTPRSR